MELLYNENGNISGHICDCGYSHKWPAYVFEHWNDKLTYTCSECKREIIIFSGNIIQKKVR